MPGLHRLVEPVRGAAAAGAVAAAGRARGHRAGLERAGWGTWAAVLWQSAGNTLFGYGAWAWLLARYPAATVSPMALLVPVFGMGASALLLGEALPGWKLLAAGLVMGGLALNLLWPRGVR
jgi:O-acetylserine/cysteine efflux transporter